MPVLARDAAELCPGRVVGDPKKATRGLFEDESLREGSDQPCLRRRHRKGDHDLLCACPARQPSVLDEDHGQSRREREPFGRHRADRHDERPLRIAPCDPQGRADVLAVRRDDAAGGGDAPAQVLVVGGHRRRDRAVPLEPQPVLASPRGFEPLFPP